MTTIVVFGSTGALGKAVVDYLRERTTTYALDHRYCDISREETVHNVLSGRYAADIVINCAGVIPDRDTDPTGASMIAANAIGPRVLAHVTGELGMKLIHVSTDCVFKPSSDMKDIYDETDAFDLYGQSKSLGEVDAGHVINVRCSFVTPDHGVAHWFLTQPYEARVEGYRGKDWNGSTVEEIAAHLGTLALGIESTTLKRHHIAAFDHSTKWHVLRLLQQNFRPDIDLIPASGPSGHLLYPTIFCRPLSEAIHDDVVRSRYRDVALRILNNA